MCLFCVVGLANYALKIAYYAFEQCSTIQPIMLKITFSKSDYALELAVLLEYISLF